MVAATDLVVVPLAATLGSMNCSSMNFLIPSIMSLWTSSCADGVEIFTSSCVNAMMPAILVIPSVTVAVVSLLSGFGLPWPTQAYVPPAVCAGAITRVTSAC